MDILRWLFEAHISAGGFVPGLRKVPGNAPAARVEATIPELAVSR